MEEGDLRNCFMINLNDSFVAELGFKVGIPGSVIRRATDGAMDADPCSRPICALGKRTELSRQLFFSYFYMKILFRSVSVRHI